MDEGLAAAGRFLEDLIGCPVGLWVNVSDGLADFEASFCFDVALQPAFTRAHLVEFVTQADQRRVYELEEPLGMVVALAWLGDVLCLVGPYTRHALRDLEAEQLLGRLRISGAHLAPYMLYRSRFPIADAEYVVRGVLGLARVAGQDAPRYGLERVVETTLPARADDLPRSAPYEQVEERYAAEQAFMDAVTDGDEAGALAAMNRMSTAGQRNAGQYLRTPYLGATIMRILTRVAAQRAGLPPVTIDAISQSHAQRLHRSGHTADAARNQSSIGDMVHEFCVHIQRHKKRPYSLLVRQAMDEIDLYLTHQVTTADLAQRLKISESQLARRFKTETGRTVSEHVAAVRVERAARLLRSTDQPVRDIAAHVGYLDANYFVKVFRAQIGMTPSGYRASQGH